MVTNSRQKYILPVLLILITLLLRFPHHPYGHEIGADGIGNHILINIIIKQGYIPWVVNIFSFAGFTEPAQPTGMFVILGEFWLLGDMDPEIGIYLFDIILSILAVLGVYLLGIYLKNRYVGFWLAIFYTTSASIYLYTYYQISIRNLFLAFLPIMILFLFRTWQTSRFNKKSFFLFAAFFMLLFVSHRMYMLLAPLIFAYILSYIWRSTYVNRYYMSTRIRHYTEISIIIYFITVGLLFYFQFLDVGIYSQSNVWNTYNTGAFFEGTSDTIHFLNMVTNYLGTIGLPVIFLPFGVYYIVKKNVKRVSDYFFLFLTILYAPILVLGTYVSKFLALFFQYLGIIGMFWVVNKSAEFVVNLKIKIGTNNIRKTTIALTIVTVLLIPSLGFNYYMENRRLHNDADGIGNKNYISQDNYESGLYLKQNPGRIAGNTIVAARSAAVSGNEYFGPSKIILCSIGYDRDRQYVIADDITFNSDYIWVYNSPSRAYHVSKNYYGEVPEQSRLNDYNVTYIVVDKKHDHGILNSQLEPITTKFYQELPSVRYKTYENDEVKIYKY